MEEEKINNVFYRPWFIPVVLALVMWLVFLIEWSTNSDFGSYGILPRQASGLKGILFSPFLHSDWEHLLNNTYPVIFLGLGVAYFYKKVSLQIFLYSLIFTGLWVWVGGRSSYHIGASGLIYCWAAFLFFSGLFKWHINLMGISLLIVFLYGSMVWGVLPWIESISWESHLLGVFAGGTLAWYFRKEGPTKKKYSWEEEDAPGDNEQIKEDVSIKIHYHYRPKEDQ